MYPVSNDFHTLSIQDAPTTRIRIYFIPDTVDCTDDEDVVANGVLLVGSAGDTDSNGRISQDGVVFNEYFNPEKNVKLGSCVSSQISMTLMNFDGALNGYAFGRCKVYIDVYDADNSTWLACPMGVYILEQPVKTKQRLISVTGYDQMQKLDASAATWWNGIDWLTTPVSMYDLLTGLATAAGFSVSINSATAMVNEATTYSFPPVDGANMTYREILSKIAEASGTIARFDRDGALDMRWFTNAESGTAQVTYNGQSISIADGTGKTVDSLTVQITPTQNLNGYGKPWAGGAGENLFEPANGADNQIYFAVQTDGSVKISGTAYTTKWTAKRVDVNLPFNGIDVGDTVTIWSDIMLNCTPYNGNTSLGQKSSTNGNAATFTIPANATFLRFSQGAKSSEVTAGEVIDTVGHYFCGKVNSFATWTPYSNICPLNGSTGLSVYVSPTQDQQDATTYAEDWSGTAGTVYAGSIEVVAGTLKARPRYASYNGETLVGPWVSSMEEYAVGVTPTTGAEVVDLGGPETAYPLTAVPIPLLSGQNYLWASNSGILTAVVSEIGLVTIDTDQIGNQCLSVDFAEYGVETYGRLTYKYGTKSFTGYWHSDSVPNPKNKYVINGNEFINQFNPGLADGYIGRIAYHLFEIGELTDPIAYYPAQAKLIMDWSIEAGDQIVIKRNSTSYVIPIFQQTLKWRGGYVVSDLLSDGDPINPNTAALAAGNEQEQQKTITLPGNYTETPVQMKPGQHFYMVVSGKPSGTNSAKELIIAQCDDDGTVSYGLAIGGNGLTCIVDQAIAPYILTVVNSTTNDATATIFYF